MAKIGKGLQKGLTYAQAERTLAGLHDAADGIRENAFRARLKHLKRLGIPLNSHPGRGSKILYDFDQVCQWAFCLELAEIGMDPTDAVEVIKQTWHFLSELFRSAAGPGKPVYLAFHPFFMATNWADGETEIAPLYGDRAVSFLREMKGLKRRAIIINLSDIVQNLIVSP